MDCDKFSKIKSTGTYNIVHNFVTVRDKKNTKHKIGYFLNRQGSYTENFSSFRQTLRPLSLKVDITGKGIFGTNFSVWGRRGQDS